MPKSHRRLVCCQSCGRDTAQPSGYCFTCFGGYHSKKAWRKRMSKPAEVLEVEPEKKTTQQEYDGETSRDDL